MATISRLLQIIRLFRRISSLLQGSFAKGTFNLKEPTNRSHPISGKRVLLLSLESFYRFMVWDSGARGPSFLIWSGYD